MFPQLIDSFLTMTGDSKNNALCIVYSHLQVTHKKGNFWWPILPCGNHDCITMWSIFTHIYPNWGGGGGWWGVNGECDG